MVFWYHGLSQTYDRSRICRFEKTIIPYHRYLEFHGWWFSIYPSGRAWWPLITALYILAGFTAEQRLTAGLWVKYPVRWKQKCISPFLDYFKEGLLNNDSPAGTLRLNIDQTITSTFKVGLSSQLTYYNPESPEPIISYSSQQGNSLLYLYNVDTLVKYSGQR